MTLSMSVIYSVLWLPHEGRKIRESLLSSSTKTRLVYIVPVSQLENCQVCGKCLKLVSIAIIEENRIMSNRTCRGVKEGMEKEWLMGRGEHLDVE